MRLLRVATLIAVAIGVIGIDVGESVRTASISDGSAHARAKRRRHHKHARKRHRKHHRRKAPASEM